jgi:hypothetical protein
MYYGNCNYYLLSLCSGTCVIRYAKGIEIFFGLYRMLEYSGVGSATLCCSGWNKSKPCFCECEDAKADCINRTVPALEIPLDDLIGKIRTDFCDMHMLTCMKNCIH